MRPVHDPGDQRRHRALHRRAGGLHGRSRRPAERRAGHGRGDGRRRRPSYPSCRLHKLEHLNDGRFGNGRSWISGEPGKGWVAGRAGRGPATIDRVVWGRDREGKYRDRLADRVLPRGGRPSPGDGGSSPRRPTAARPIGRPERARGADGRRAAERADLLARQASLRGAARRARPDAAGLRRDVPPARADPPAPAAATRCSRSDGGRPSATRRGPAAAVAAGRRPRGRTSAGPGPLDRPTRPTRCRPG